MPTSVEQFDKLVAKSNFVFVVFYRGHWCPFCMKYLKDFQKIVPEIKAKGGIPIIVTAEHKDHLSDTLAKTKFAGETIVDSQIELAQELKARNLVNVAISKKAGYPDGMIQPAVLVLRKDGQKVYSWAIDPSVMNLGGAKDRVDLGEVWEDVQLLLTGAMSKPRDNYNRQSFFTGLKQAVFG